MMANSVGVVDPFYDGDDDENMAFLYNFTDHDVTVEQGDRVVQGMIIRTEPITWNEVDSMESDGHGGYQHLDELHSRQRSA
jgi:dUTPase